MIRVKNVTELAEKEMGQFAPTMLVVLAQNAPQAHCDFLWLY